MLAFLLAAGLNSAHAVPVTMTHQGRLLDSSGAGLSGFHDLTFAFYDANAGGNVLWYDTVAASFTDGYYSVTLGSSSSNPLEDDVFENDTLYLELALDSNPAMSPRLAVTSAPFARVAGYAETAEVATSVEGGLVDAAEVAINGTTVIDSNGDWVGQSQGGGLANLNCSAGQTISWDGANWVCSAVAGTPSWSSIANRPAGLDDGDDDTLGSLGCATGEIVAWNGAAWSCAADNGLTESEVEAYIVNDPIDLAAGSMVDGSEILTDASVLMSEWTNVLNVPADLADGDDDTLAGLSCQGGEMAAWDAASSAWICSSGGSTQGAFATQNTIGVSDGGTDYASLDTPELIPDDNTFGFTSARYIADSLTITTMSLDLQVTHPEMGELTAVLTSPAGTTVELVASSYAGQADFNGNIGWDFAFANGDLYSFYDEDTVGTWTLNVVDAGAGNTGTLESWTLRFNEDWDGELFVGDNVTVQETLAVRGEMRIEYGGDLVMTNTDGVETLRLSAESPASVLTTANVSDKMYINTNSGTYSTHISVNCDAGDLMISGGCRHDSSGYRLYRSHPLETNGIPDGWSCSWHSNNYQTSRAYAVCMDLD